MVVKKSASPTSLPGTHPGLMQRIREAEDAEVRGEEPRSYDEVQKVLRPSIDATSAERAKQVRSIGLIDPAYREGVDGRDELALQEAFRPGDDLDVIWDSLSEAEKIQAGATERLRLEMEAALRRSVAPWVEPHQIAGRLNARNLKRSGKNLHAEVAAYAGVLAPDSRALLKAFVDETCALIDTGLRLQAFKGIEAPILHQLLRDWLHKLVYQEVSSRQRAMGDRGIRRICANIELADDVYQQLKKNPEVIAKQRLLMRLIHIHQDLGYTAYAARVSFRGGRLHRAYSARMFNDELNSYRAVFHFDELEYARHAVATHSAAALPFKEQRVLGLIRAIDHLAPLAPYRVYKHFEEIPGCVDYLDDMLLRVKAGKAAQFAALREHLAQFLTEQDMHPVLRQDMMAAFRPFDKLAEAQDLGEMAGQVCDLVYDVKENPGRLMVKVQHDSFARKYQVLFDQQQDQLIRLAKLTEVDLRRLQTDPTVRFQVEGYGALVIRRL